MTHTDPYCDPCSFMENLQSEVIELEFLEFSRGLATISEEDFARILLRYTMLDSSNIEECIKRVRSRTPSEKVRPYNLTLVIFKKGTLGVGGTVILQELFPFTTGNYLIDAVYCKQSCMISTDITIINVLVFMLFNPNYFLEFLCMISYFKRLKKVIHVLIQESLGS